MAQRVNIDFLYAQKFLGQLKANPSRTRAAFVVGQANLTENNYQRTLWLLENDELRQLTSIGKEGAFQWLDDDRLLFQAARSPEEEKAAKEGYPETTLYCLDLRGGEALPYLKLPFRLGTYAVLADGSFVMAAETALDCKDFYAKSKKEQKEFVKAQEEAKDWRHLRELPFYFNGAGYVNGNWESFVYVRRAEQQLEPAMIRPLHAEQQMAGALYLSEDRKRVYFTTNEPQKGKMSEFQRLYRFDGEQAGQDPQAAVQVLLDEPYLSISMVWEREPAKGAAGRLLMLASDQKRYGVNETPVPYEIQAGEATRLSDFEGRYWNSIGSDCRLVGGPQAVLEDGAFIVGATVTDHSALKHFDGENCSTLYENPEESIDCFNKVQGKFYAVVLKPTQAQELYRLEETGWVPVSHFNTELCARYSLQKPKRLAFPHSLGMEGFVLLPDDYDPSQKYPAILDIHGGPRTVYGQVLYHEMQYWAALGFIVFFCNPRGGDGRGDAFADIRGQYGGPDYDDLMAFTDAVLKAYPAIDPERLGVTGGSYGGFMTNWIIGHTQRFKAAATQRSIMNWTSFYGTSDIGFYFATDQCGTDTFSQAGFAKMWEHSPMKYINSVSTPTLIIHSDEDYRCPLEQAMQLYVGLKDRGIDTEMYIFKGENHELSRSGKPRARTRRLTAIADWMCRYLTPEGSLEKRAAARGVVEAEKEED